MIVHSRSVDALVAFSFESLNIVHFTEISVCTELLD